MNLLTMLKTIDSDNKSIILSTLFEAMDEQKVDLLISSDNGAPFTGVVRENAI